MTDPDAPHICFGCTQPIGDNQPHIHVPMDQWATSQGLPSAGLADLFAAVFCEPCTTQTQQGWQLQAHPLTPDGVGS